MPHQHFNAMQHEKKVLKKVFPYFCFEANLNLTRYCTSPHCSQGSNWNCLSRSWDWQTSHLFVQSVKAIVIAASVAPESLLVLGGHCGHGDASRGEVEEVVNHGNRDGIWQVDGKAEVVSVAPLRNWRVFFILFWREVQTSTLGPSKNTC